VELDQEVGLTNKPELQPLLSICGVDGRTIALFDKHISAFNPCETAI
jgi:hypothetical protein